MKRCWIVVMATLAMIFSPFANAQEYPTKVITMIVPFAAGGPTDTVARMIAQSMTKELKQSVIVENAAGAGGTIGANKVAKAPPDGYTLLLHHIGHATAPALYPKLPYNVSDDFEPIGLVADVPMTIVAKKEFPAKDLKELIAYVKANKDTVNIGSAGPGSVSHLCALLFMSAIDTSLTIVQYKGAGPMMNDLLGSQIDFACDQTTNTTGQIKGGKIKAYGVTTKARLAAFKDLPTLQETGLSNFEVTAWHGFYAPKGTPKPIVDKLSKTLQIALKDPAVVQRFTDLAAEPAAANQATPEALRPKLKSEVDKWAPIIKKAGVYGE